MLHTAAHTAAHPPRTQTRSSPRARAHAQGREISPSAAARPCLDLHTTAPLRPLDPLQTVLRGLSAAIRGACQDKSDRVDCNLAGLASSAAAAAAAAASSLSCILSIPGGISSGDKCSTAEQRSMAYSCNPYGESYRNCRRRLTGGRVEGAAHAARDANMGHQVSGRQQQLVCPECLKRSWATPPRQYVPDQRSRCGQPDDAEVPAPPRVGEHVAIGVAAERSAATRLKAPPLPMHKGLTRSPSSIVESNKDSIMDYPLTE